MQRLSSEWLEPKWLSFQIILLLLSGPCEVSSRKNPMDLAYMCVKPQMRLYVCQTLPLPNTKCVYMCVTKCVYMCVTKCVYMCVTKCVYMCVTKCVYMCVTKCVC